MSRKYSHIIVIGVDGAGSWFKVADTPNFDKIFENGAITYKALSSKPTISAECWGSMLIGVGPEIHGLTNGIVSSVPYDVNSPFPSVFRRIKEAYPDAVLGSFCDWNPITHGIVENNIGVSHDTAPDTELTPVVCNYISENKPDFLFIHFDSVDGADTGRGTDFLLLFSAFTRSISLSVMFTLLSGMQECFRIHFLLSLQTMAEQMMKTARAVTVVGQMKKNM